MAYNTSRLIHGTKVKTECHTVYYSLSSKILDDARIREVGGLRANPQDPFCQFFARGSHAKLLCFNSGRSTGNVISVISSENAACTVCNGEWKSKVVRCCRCSGVVRWQAIAVSLEGSCRGCGAIRINPKFA